jgi:hypothetical protein
VENKRCRRKSAVSRRKGATIEVGVVRSSNLSIDSLAFSLAFQRCICTTLAVMEKLHQNHEH